MKFKQVMIILVHALVIWMVCGGIMYAGMSFTTMTWALIIHAVGAPLVATAVSLLYFNKFHYTAPLATAAIFMGVVIFMDVFVVALLIEKNFAMFSSLLGTWIPFALIFTATYLTGRRIVEKGGAVTAVSSPS